MLRAVRRADVHDLKAEMLEAGGSYENVAKEFCAGKTAIKLLSAERLAGQASED